MLDDDRRPCAFFGRPIQARVVDCDRCASAEVFRELEVVLSVETSGIGGDQHQPAEGAPGGDERDDHCGRHSELVQDLVVR